MEKKGTKIVLPVTIFKENRFFIAYTSTLDLAVSGKSFDDAHEKLNEAIYSFFEEIIKNGNVDEVLWDLGWKKINKEWTPPLIHQEKTEINIQF